MSVPPELPTVSFDGAPPGADQNARLPLAVGRYRVTRILGHGGFGTVYQAHDEQLQRLVAVKVPHNRVLPNGKPMGDSLTEARVAAGLDHPHIVPVYDVGGSVEFPSFIVSKYIDGISLSTAVATRKFSSLEIASLIADVAGALHYAHTRGLVHRDVKPGNVLLDHNGTAYLTDFGLALREEQYGQVEGTMFGTPYYMSPEQARGEGHLVDGRADVFSLGAILYELLTGMRPFQGRTADDVLHAVMTLEPRPLRQKNELIPRELERVCLRALAKRTADRYETARDMEDDLRHFLGLTGGHATPTVMVEPIAAGELPALDLQSSWTSGVSRLIVPKGLRAFDESDRDFFLSLLPGPLDRDGLPQSLRFWKTRLEDAGLAKALRVGVVYGPSGCGKSSLVRAGLLPNLNRSIHPVVITATADSTESQLLDELRRCLHQDATGLVEAVLKARLNRDGERRLLIVIDQFEQWLHANQPDSECELVQALRQCDGTQVACLLTVRDDFWMSVHRFFRELDLRLAEHENCAAVDLFDTRHARRVLHAFGHAYGALPGRTDDLSQEQRDFLDQAIGELAENDRVISVRLALFAQMVRNRPWTPATLQMVGGAQGVGIRFLEDTLGSPSAPLPYRVHQTAVREILRVLLPPPGTDIKACTRTSAELAKAANCPVDSSEFQQLIAILEEETRLITPVESRAEEQRTATREQSAERPYQLTHDYLVPSIREWLTNKQRETWRGRCALRLDERSALWNAQHENKQLPTLWETAQISVGTKSAEWTSIQARMMQHARRVHGRRLTFVAAIVLCGCFSVWSWQYQAKAASDRNEADNLVEQLRLADMEHVAPVLKGMRRHLPLATRRLTDLSSDPKSSAAVRLRAEMALLMGDSERLPSLLKLAWDANPASIRAIREWLSTELPPNQEVVWQLTAAKDVTSSRRLRLGALLAEFDSSAQHRWAAIAPDLGRALVSGAGLDADQWSDLLLPARAQIAPALAAQFLESATTPSERITLARVLAKLGSTDLLCQLLVEADPAAFSLLIQAVERDANSAVGNLRPVLLERPPTSAPADRLRVIRRQSLAACALLRLDQGNLVWPLLEASADSTLRSDLMLAVRDFEIPYATLARGEPAIENPVARQAIWMLLASYKPDLTSHDKVELVQRMMARLNASLSLVERSGIAWALKHLDTPDEVLDILSEPNQSGENWSVNSQRLAFLHVRGPVSVTMGSPEGEARREFEERQHVRRIERDFAISLHEITVAQFLDSKPDYKGKYDPYVSQTPECPASSISWFDAVRYCRWLSDKEEMAEDQMCYPPLDKIGPDMQLPPDFLSRTGYRLPTEAEWEYACRGGTTTRFHFGESEHHISAFCWWVENGEDRAWPIGTRWPNQFGLFDMQGNLNEWCHDPWSEYPQTKSIEVIDSQPIELRPFDAAEYRVNRGANFRQWLRKLRSAQRAKHLPVEDFSILGFRVARTLPTKQN